MEDKNILRHIFLRELTRQLVVLSAKEDFVEPVERRQIKKPRPDVNKNAVERMMIHKVNALPVPPRPKMEKLPPSKKEKSKEMNSLNNMQPSIMAGETPKIEAPKPNTVQRPVQGFDLGKVRNLLSDPRIQTIECQGPNKPVLVKKDGNILSTRMVLTKDEVNQIIQNFSRESKVPLIGGTFKAMVGNLIMTAVESEFVGSRFIIQKRNPFEKEELFSPGDFGHK